MMSILGFDRSLLQDADLEFVVIADTHYMADPGDSPVEFDSRRHQSRRAEFALQLAASLEPAFVVHLGDLVQAYPETADYTDACTEARRQIAAIGLTPHVAVGNHDVGDKPDPTMPTAPVEPGFLNGYHGEYGCSWYSFDHGNCHFAVINSQILNQTNIHAAEQKAWLERDLSAAAGKRPFLFLHLPPYLHLPNEPHLGHYDNIGEPAREWLLDLVREHAVEMLLAAHVHFIFHDLVGATSYYTLPSTSFARPGFSHLFTSGPPPERGRDDVGKLGFFLCRVRQQGTDVHLVRTNGIEGGGRFDQALPSQVLTRTSPTLPDSQLGLTLVHPLATVGQVPVAYPSLVRQSVRNDYPLLACVELGARAVRIPSTDLGDPLQARRLELLRAEGLRVVATHLWSGPRSLQPVVDRHGGQADTWELQLPGERVPGPGALADIETFNSTHGSPLSICPVLPGERLDPVKQHARTRVGYELGELEELDSCLGRSGIHVDRALCRIRPGEAWSSVAALRTILPLRHIGGVDLRLELPAGADHIAADAVAEALFAVATLSDSTLFVEPLVDLDRTLDTCPGLLDVLCNPREAFHVARCLNSILHADLLHPETLQASTTRDSGAVCLWIHSPRRSFGLITSVAPGIQGLDPVLADLPEGEGLRLYDLCGGTVDCCPVGCLSQRARSSDISPPLLVTIDRTIDR
jgi:hypothetical protein